MHSILKFIRKQKNFFLPFIFLCVFISLTLLKAPIKQVFEYDTDEGTALMKTQLYLRGFSLYNEIWDDQPPLLTVMLSSCLNFFGPSAYPARILILFFSALLLWALYLIITSENGSLCAFIALIFLILSTGYLRLSLSIMPAIPSLSFALLSIYYAICFKKQHFNRLLILSGIFMAISLQTKLITAFLIPIILLEILRAEKTNSDISKKQTCLFTPVIFWLIGFITIYIAIAIIFFRFNLDLFYQQLIMPHLARLSAGRNDFSVIWKRIFIDYDIAILALISAITFRKNKSCYLPILWLISISLILFIYKPIWHHYYLLMALPLCWLAAISFSKFFQTDTFKSLFRQKNIWRGLLACLVGLTILRIPAKYHQMLESVKNQPSLEERKITTLLAKHKKHTRWLITDRPIFAFYGKILVPPELALISSKRIQAENFTQDYLRAILKKYEPELVLFARFAAYEKKILPYIEKDYLKIYPEKLNNYIWDNSRKELKLYLRKPS